MSYRELEQCRTAKAATSGQQRTWRVHVVLVVPSARRTALHCLHYILHHNIVYLCHMFVTSELVLLWDEESVPELSVLDVDGQTNCLIRRAHTANL